MHQASFITGKEITELHISEYRDMLLGETSLHDGNDPQKVIPSCTEIGRELRNNGGVMALLQGKVIGGIYATKIPKMDMLELGSGIIQESLRHSRIFPQIISRVIEIIGDKPAICIMKDLGRKRRMKSFPSFLLKRQDISPSALIKLEEYGSLDGHIILANQQGHILLTSELS